MLWSSRKLFIGALLIITLIINLTHIYAADTTLPADPIDQAGATVDALEAPETQKDIEAIRSKFDKMPGQHTMSIAMMVAISTVIATFDSASERSLLIYGKPADFQEKLDLATDSLIYLADEVTFPSMMLGSQALEKPVGAILKKVGQEAFKHLYLKQIIGTEASKAAGDMAFQLFANSVKTQMGRNAFSKITFSFLHTAYLFGFWEFFEVWIEIARYFTIQELGIKHPEIDLEKVTYFSVLSKNKIVRQCFFRNLYKAISPSGLAPLLLRNLWWHNILSGEFVTLVSSMMLGPAIVGTAAGAILGNVPGGAAGFGIGVLGGLLGVYIYTQVPEYVTIAVDEVFDSGRYYGFNAAYQSGLAQLSLSLKSLNATPVNKTSVQTILSGLEFGREATINPYIEAYLHNLAKTRQLTWEIYAREKLKINNLEDELPDSKYVHAHLEIINFFKGLKFGERILSMLVDKENSEFWENVDAGHIVDGPGILRSSIVTMLNFFDVSENGLTHFVREIERPSPFKKGLTRGETILINVLKNYKAQDEEISLKVLAGGLKDAGIDLISTDRAELIEEIPSLKHELKSYIDMQTTKERKIRELYSETVEDYEDFIGMQRDYFLHDVGPTSSANSDFNINQVVQDNKNNPEKIKAIFEKKIGQYEKEFSICEKAVKCVGKSMGMHKDYLANMELSELNKKYAACEDETLKIINDSVNTIERAYAAKSQIDLAYYPACLIKLTASFISVESIGLTYSYHAIRSPEDLIQHYEQLEELSQSVAILKDSVEKVIDPIIAYKKGLSSNAGKYAENYMNEPFKYWFKEKIKNDDDVRFVLENELRRISEMKYNARNFFADLKMLSRKDDYLSLMQLNYINEQMNSKEYLEASAEDKKRFEEAVQLQVYTNPDFFLSENERIKYAQNQFIKSKMILVGWEEEIWDPTREDTIDSYDFGLPVVSLVNFVDPFIDELNEADLLMCSSVDRRKQVSFEDNENNDLLWSYLKQYLDFIEYQDFTVEEFEQHLSTIVDYEDNLEFKYALLDLNLRIQNGLPLNYIDNEIGDVKLDITSIKIAGLLWREIELLLLSNPSVYEIVSFYNENKDLIFESCLSEIAFIKILLDAIEINQGNKEKFSTIEQLRKFAQEKYNEKIELDKVILYERPVIEKLYQELLSFDNFELQKKHEIFFKYSVESMFFNQIFNILYGSVVEQNNYNIQKTDGFNIISLITSYL
ncbi:MAG: hypothetical protein ABIA04_11800 [Pseudomonadota bacterium]